MTCSSSSYLLGGIACARASCVRRVARARTLCTRSRQAGGQVGRQDRQVRTALDNCATDVCRCGRETSSAPSGAAKGDLGDFSGDVGAKNEGGETFTFAAIVGTMIPRRTTEVRTTQGMRRKWVSTSTDREGARERKAKKGGGGSACFKRLSQTRDNESYLGERARKIRKKSPRWKKWPFVF